MKATMFFLPLLVALLSFSCAKNVDAAPVVTDPTPKSLPPTVDKNLLLQLVNKVRQNGCQCGDTYYYPVPAVTWNAQLEVAAYNHSTDMYQNKYFSHTAPDGSRAGDRIEKAGYNWMAYGENIGTGYKKESDVMDGWLKSEEHCKNIMNKMYKDLGVARVGNYWTQEFATK